MGVGYVLCQNDRGPRQQRETASGPLLFWRFGAKRANVLGYSTTEVILCILEDLPGTALVMLYMQNLFLLLLKIFLFALYYYQYIALQG